MVGMKFKDVNGEAQTRNDLKRALNESTYSYYLFDENVVDEVFFLDEGQVGGPYKGPWGYYVVYVVQKLRPTQPVNYRDERQLGLLQEDHPPHVHPLRARGPRGRRGLGAVGPARSGLEGPAPASRGRADAGLARSRRVLRSARRQRAPQQSRIRPVSERSGGSLLPATPAPLAGALVVVFVLNAVGALLQRGSYPAAADMTSVR